ncbi:MAG: glycosyltransferase family protein [Ginsengibacter sp.]
MTTGNHFNNNIERPRILICPLDWGLGHATRCIPIIKELIALNCEVMIAADTSTFSLLKKEFPAIVFLRIKGYEMTYSRHKNGLWQKLLVQIPKIIFKIKQEKNWLKKVIARYKPDAVISDNRFGMYSTKVPSIYITHQLFIKTGNAFTDMLAQKIHYYFIKKYAQCWVPDFTENELAGELSHPEKIQSNVIYMGALSRFQPIKNIQKIYDLLISISGPEPQRSIFENIILQQLDHFRGNALLVRGLPSEPGTISSSNPSVKIVNHLMAVEFNLALEQSEIVISRSGYTTIMDLVKLNKKAILIPTPGQTEQEYLAKYLLQKKIFYSTKQEKFSLKEALEKSSSFPYTNPHISCDDYKNVINEFVGSLKTGNFVPQ